MNDALDRAPIGVVEATRDGTVTAMNAAATDLLGVLGDETGGHVDGVFPRSVDNAVPAAFDDDGPPERTVEEYYPDLDRWLEVSLVPAGEGVTIYLEETTERHDSERGLARLREERDRLTLIHGLISDVLSDLVGASTREEVAETICDRLGETDVYRFAWLGEREVGGDDITVRASAGATGRTLDSIAASLDDGTPPAEARAIETGTPRIVQPIAEDESVPDAVRRAAFADGLHSLLAIPITHGSSVHGVVGVYSAEPEAFSERARGSFATVGEVAGFAVNAVRHRNVLLSDTVVELTLEVTDRGTPLVAATAGTDVELRIDGLVSQDADRVLAYLAIEGASPDRMLETFADLDHVSPSRIVADQSDAGRVETELGGESVIGELSARGATIRSAVFDGGSGRIVVDLPPEEDIRRILDAITREYDAELAAKRERDRPVSTAREFRDELRDRLTEKQETALRTAFHADYFESPRGSTAEEVAEALDITGPTLLYHLRAGQRKLVDEFLGTAGPR